MIKDTNSYATLYMKLTTDFARSFRISTLPLRTGSIYLVISVSTFGGDLSF